MKIVKNVRSSIKPETFDDMSSENIVYVRSDIKEIKEVDPVFNTISTVYDYTETQYTYSEWYRLITNDLQDQSNNAELVLIDIVNLLIPILDLEIMTLELDDENKPSNPIKSAALIKIYKTLIQKGLITIDKVPQLFVSEVEESLLD